MTVTRQYTPVGTDEADPVSTSYFMMNNLLYSRMESGYPSNDEVFDEDVNVYLANLLESMIDPAYHEMLSRLVVPYDLPLYESIAEENDPRAKFITYKVNADFLLVSLGIFNNPRRKRPGSAMHMNISADSYTGRAKAYYGIAQSYSRQLFHRGSAISDIMGKLSTGFEKYVRVLALMKSEYFNIVGRITEGEMFHLERAIREKDIQEDLGRLRDEFLDAYSEYRRSGSESTLRTLGEISRRIRILDPTFSFEPPK